MTINSRFLVPIVNNNSKHNLLVVIKRTLFNYRFEIYCSKFPFSYKSYYCSSQCPPFLYSSSRKVSEIYSTKCMGTMASSSSSSSSKNRLQHEKSPYLLQHQSNPVDWYPWSEEAFAIAKSKNKPIFLSVGYSTCHWCHVMERESFENHDIAKIMNANFVNIKMDREERPDIDKIYMTFVQAISGSGGWPMSVWMTPQLKPIYGGTYYPPEDRYFGRPGFRALLQTISDQWNENEEKCHDSGAKIMGVLQRSAELAYSEIIAPADAAAAKCIQQLTRSYEPTYGGFSDHPKFPQPVNLHFLIDWTLKNKDDPNRFSVIKMIERTMKEMAKGGIHDHIGQGFARYSTDKKWHVPHFEKMLYDQSQLTVAYANAYLLTNDEFYADIVRDILTYVGRDLSHPEGGFYSAEDADSYATFDSKEKKEGAFYAWKNSEIEQILGDKTLSTGEAKFSDVFKFRYGVKEKGNVDAYNDPHDELKEQNVLFEAHTIEETVTKFAVSQDEIILALDEAKTTLFNYRNVNRPRPGLDTKFVTSWNGLMISGYARAGMALKSQEYIDRGVKAMDFLTKYVIKKDSGFDLLRACYRDETNQGVTNLKSPIFGCVDDFANLVGASIELFHATFDPKYLQLAIKLQEKQDDLFWDTELGGYFTSRAGDPSVIVRMKDDDDGAEPSSNSTSVINLIRLHSITGVYEYKKKIEKLFKQFSERLSKVPITLPVMTSALTSYSSGPVSILITGQNIKNHEVVQQLRTKLLSSGTAITGVDFGNTESVTLLKTLSPQLSNQFNEQLKETTARVKRGKDGETTTVSIANDWSKIF